MLYAKASRMIRIVSRTHTCSYLTCWVSTFSCLSRERTVHYTIMLISTVFLLYALVSNCYHVMIFFIRIIREKFEFTWHAHSWSFANIIVLCRLGSVHVIFLSYYYQEKNELKWKMYIIRPFPNKYWCEFQNFHIHPRSAVDSAQWDLGHYIESDIYTLSVSGYPKWLIVYAV